MNYKIERAINKNKKYFGIFAILWLVLTIVFVAPLATTIVESTVEGKLSFDGFISSISTNVTDIGGNLGKIFTSRYLVTFFDILLKYTVVFIIFIIIGIIKMRPKNEYSDIEHGSSDWSENGEQYKVLSRNKGIVLAEKNYLPLDKMGNVNVLIVGRFWCW